MKVQIKVLSGEYVHANRHYLADAVFNFTLVNAMLGVSVIYFLPVLLQSIAFFVLSRLKKVLELIGKTLNRSRHQRCSMKNSVLRNFTKFTGKHLCQILFFYRVAGLRPATLLKRDSGTSVFLWILWNFQEHLFYRTPWWCSICNIPSSPPNWAWFWSHLCHFYYVTSYCSFATDSLSFKITLYCGTGLPLSSYP